MSGHHFFLERRTNVITILSRYETNRQQEQKWPIKKGYKHWKEIIWYVFDIILLFSLRTRGGSPKQNHKKYVHFKNIPFS